MLSIKQKHLRLISRRFWSIFFGGIIALAVLVQIGRQAFPLMNDYRHIIAESLSEQLGVTVNIGQISAHWRGLRPEMALSQLSIHSRSGQEVFVVEHVMAELSLIDTFIQRGLAWRTITFEKFQTTIVQEDDNSWRIKGYDGGTANNENPFNFDDPLDIFLFGRRVEINSALLNFEFKNGKSAELSIPTISLENDRFFHRMKASFNINEKESLRLVIEGYGDPRNKEKFSASGYLNLAQIPIGDLYDAVVKGASNEPALALPRAQTLDLELWFKGSPRAGMTAKGMLDISGLPSELEEKFDLPERLTTSLAGAWNRKTGWFMNLQDIQLAWGQNNIPLDSLNFYGSGANLGVRTEAFDLGALVGFMIEANKDRSGFIADTLTQLRPSGIFRNVDMQFTSAEQGYFVARGYLENGSAGAFKGSPELKNINGYVESSLLEGYIDASVPEGFVLNLPKVFDEPFVLDDMHGQFGWRILPDEKTAFLRSSRVTAKQANKRVAGSFAVTLPFKKEYGEQTLSFILNLDHADVLEYKRYLPKKVPASLREWLGRAVLSGEVERADVFYYGSVAKKPKVKPTYQVSAYLKDTAVQFDKKWPQINHVQGTLLIDSDDISVHVDSGVTKGNHLAHAEISLIYLANKKRGVNINAKFDGETSSAKTLLLSSPVKASVDSFLPEWHFQGTYKADVSVQVPLVFTEDELDYSIDVTLDNNALLIESINLPLSNINGVFNYSKEHLLSFKKMRSSLFGNPFDLIANTDFQLGEIAVEFDGLMNVDALQRWSKRDEFVFVQDDIDIRGTLHIPVLKNNTSQGISLNVASDLDGVAIDLPFPLGKQKNTKGEFDTDISILENGIRYEYNHNNKMKLDVFSEKGVAPRSLVSIGGSLGDVRSVKPGQTEISGVIEHVVYDDWKQALDTYIGEKNKNNGSGAGSDVVDVRAKFIINEFVYSDIVVPELDVSIKGDEFGWRFDGYSDMFKGAVILPVDEAITVLDIAVLNLFTDDIDEPEEESESALTGIDLAGFSPLRVKIDALKIKNDDWGRWSFDVSPVESGLHFTQLKASVKALNIGKDVPADFVWTKQNGNHQSTFIGTIDTGNAGDALEEWGQERMLESRTAHFDIHASWMGLPDQVSLLGLDGDVVLDIAGGSFLRVGEVGENPLLRLIALFNFDTFARRLRLDFSDLAAKGFAFDRVRSELKFVEGIVTLSEPLLVESSSSKMQMAGVVNLEEELIDADLVVTLPVAGNLAVATAFVAGLPAGVGVYVVSKMLGEKVNKVSSINYSVQGNWSDPKLKVKKVFDDTAARKKGESLKNGKPTVTNPASEKGREVVP